MLHFTLFYQWLRKQEPFLSRLAAENLFLILILFSTGIIWSFDKLKTIPIHCLFMIAGAMTGLLIMALIFIAKMYRRDNDRIYSFLFFIFTLFVIVLHTFYSMVLPYQKACGLYDKHIKVEGTVVSYIPETKSAATLTNPLIQSDFSGVTDTNGKEGGSVLIRTNEGLVSIYSDFSGIQYGDRIAGVLYFKRFSARRNPGGFDEEQYYHSNGIYLKGTVKGGLRIISKQAELKDLIFRAAYGVRSKMMRIFLRNLPEKEAGLMAGLLLGDCTKIGNEDRAVYKKSGLSHITAVSGSAVAFLLIPFQAVLKKIKTKKKRKSLMIFILLLFFGFITGWTASVSRALLMVFIMMTAKGLHKNMTSVQALFVSIPILLMIRPVFALNIGFWLSGAATAGIIRLSKIFRVYLENKFFIPAFLSETMAACMAAGISVIPLAVWFSRTISFSSLISNLPVLPLVEFATIVGSLEAISGMITESNILANLIAVPLKGILFLIYQIAYQISKLDYLQWNLNCLSILFLPAVSGVILFLFLKEKKKKRWCILFSTILLMTATVHSAVIRFSEPELRVVFADVGQGDSTLMILKTGESVLIDSGGETKGYGPVTQMMDYYNITYPDIYIATHTHEDHCGAMIRMIRDRGGKALMLPYGAKAAALIGDEGGNADPVKNLYKEKNLTYELISAAQKANMEIIETGKKKEILINDHTKLLFLYPEMQGKKEKGTVNINENSLVILLEFYNHRIIIMGDASGDTEAALMNSGVDLSAEIYRISHHGSPSSTNHDIISGVNPKIAVISVGTNLYGHPSPKVIQRLEESGCSVLRTDECGAVLLEGDETRLFVSTMIP